MLTLITNGRLETPDEPGVVLPWWSFTKTVLAAVALTLVRDGRVGLDDALPGQPFTLRQLLRHEAGLADYSELAAYHAAVAAHETPWSAADMLQRLDAERLRYAPGDGWRYSNVGYLYVRNLIERLTDLPLREALAQRAFAPLGLGQVQLVRTRADLGGTTLPGAADYDPGWVYHGLLVGPLAEAGLFLDHLLSGHLLPQALVREMQAARLLGGPIPGRPWTAPGYALGLMQGAADNGLLLSGHTGSGPGSVVAVYHCALDGRSATCAAFRADEDQAAVETAVVRAIHDSLGTTRSHPSA